MKKILVIDDDKPFCAVVMTTLRRNGYEVFGAGNGAEGLAQALAVQPSLILSDVNMGGRNGFELLKELRARPETSAIPVIMMTGEPQRNDARFSMSQGADDYLPKPFAMEEMLASVRGRLSRQDGITRAVDAQNQAHRLSTEEKLRLQTTALEATANGIMITDREGHILWVNPAFAALTGYTAEEVLGQNPRIFKSKHQSPDFYTGLWATIATGSVWHGELVNQRKDGSSYYEEMTITPVRDAAGNILNFIAIKQDITERKKTEQVLAQERDLLQALMDNQPDFIYFKDANSRYTRINRALTRHLGLQQPEEAIGKSDEDFFPLHEARQKLTDERRLISTGQPVVDVVERSATAKETKWLSSTKVPIYGDDSKIAGLVGISHDITERQKTEEELQRKSAFLEAQVNSSIDGIFVLDGQERKIVQNQRMTDMFQIPPAIANDPDHEKQRRWTVQMAKDPEQRMRKIIYLKSHRNEISREEIELKDGRIFDCYTTPVLSKNGTYFGRMWTFRDITERKRAEEPPPPENGELVETMDEAAAVI
jgi:PAS domain S-box-containing protein